MEAIVVVSVIGVLIVMLLIVGASIKPIYWIGQGLVKLIIGAVFLFFLNTIGNSMGIHVPINLVTSSVAGLLGLPGVAMLAAVNVFVL